MKFESEVVHAGDRNRTASGHRVVGGALAVTATGHDDVLAAADLHCWPGPVVRHAVGKTNIGDGVRVAGRTAGTINVDVDARRGAHRMLRSLEDTVDEEELIDVRIGSARLNQNRGDVALAREIRKEAVDKVRAAARNLDTVVEINDVRVADARL